MAEILPDVKEGEYILVDVDGTLFTYTEWVKWDQFGDPIQPMIQRVQRWLQAGIEVRLFTARVPLNDGEVQTCKVTGEAFTGIDMKFALANLTEKYIGQRLRAQCWKDWRAHSIWDDRAVQVIPNEGIVLADMGVQTADWGKAWGGARE
jgi:hypothetical protein